MAQNDPRLGRLTITPELLAQVRRLRAQGVAPAAIRERLGLSKATFTRMTKALRQSAASTPNQGPLPR